MDPKEIIEHHLKKQKDKERGVKICDKCRGEMKKQGKRTSGNVNYMIWQCIKCGKETTELVGLEEDAMKNIQNTRF
ncbi:MAG: hypothetical protein ACLFPQ_03905 [Candidatus Woesearchaeota archaeon]